MGRVATSFLTLGGFPPLDPFVFLRRIMTTNQPASVCTCVDTVRPPYGRGVASRRTCFPESACPYLDRILGQGGALYGLDWIASHRIALSVEIQVSRLCRAAGRVRRCWNYA